MKLNLKITNMGVFISIIVFIIMRYLPAETRNLIPLFFAIIGLSMAIYFYKKNGRKYEFKLFLILSVFMLILFSAYIEHKILNTSYLLNLYGFLTIGAMVIVFSRVMLKSYYNKDIANFIVSLVLIIAIILITIAIILVNIFRIQL